MPGDRTVAPLVCIECASPAVWLYMPGTGDRRFCEAHVPRGCSCQLDADGKSFLVDEEGRPFPCCEYDWIGPTDDT